MKRYLLFLATLLNAVWASAQYSGSGNGTESSPYLIYNTTQLYQMNNFLGSDHAGVVFKLMKDLDLSDFINDNFPSQGWSPIGVEATPFQGKFYGNNHTLSGLWINRTSINNVGFFGYVSGAEIKDLTIESDYVHGSFYVGTLVGYAIGSTITNCHVSGTGAKTVKGGYVGGVAGYITGSTSMTDCSFNGNCVKSTASDSYAGGFVGYAESSTLTNCDATTTNIIAKAYTGGIAGWASEVTLSNCKAKCDIASTANTGGICGCIGGTSSLSDCKSEGDIVADTYVAGVVGTLNAGSSVTFTNTHSKGKITNTGDYTGGIVGISNGGCIAGMESCSHFGDISGKNYVGGLVGGNMETSGSDDNVYISTSSTENTKTVSKSTGDFVTGTDEIIINNCTAIGNITGSLYVGGLVGWDEKALRLVSKNGGPANIDYYNYNVYGKYVWYGEFYTGLYYEGWYNGTVSFKPNFRLSTLAYTNCYYSGIINGIDNVGGIIGYKKNGRVQNCYTNASVYGSNNVGGIIGNAEGYSTSTLMMKSNVAINNTISATVDNIGRIYGTKNENVTIGDLGSAEGNRALTTTKVIKKGVVQEVIDNLQNGNVMGKSLLKLKANYVALGWNFDENWEILETECYPYKKYQAAPPVIESALVSQDTQINGSSTNGGTVYLYYKDRDAVSTVCNGHAWTFSTEKLQSGASVQLYADADGMTPSYLTSTTVGYPGSGTEADPYRIYTAEDLQGASNRGYYKLMNDIDLSAWINENSPTKGWVAIGRNSGEATYINGDGHKVTGLWINTTDDYTGLFSNFSAGVIKNLTVEVASGKKVKGGDFTGILIGRNANGQILNCTVKGDVEGTKHVGGVTGYSGNNTITGVAFEGNVTSNADNAYVGGFAGLSENDAITSVKTKPTISATGASNYVGGTIGYMNGGTITKSRTENALTASGTGNYVGGLVGYSKGDITLSFSTGTVTASGEDSYTGGLVGYAYNPIENCYSTAKTTGTLYTAGLCAYTFSTIDKCYAKGDVYGSRYGAGVVAQLDGASAAITNSIAVNNKLDLTDQSAWGCRVIGGFSNGAAEPNNSNYALSTMQVSLNGVAQKKTDDNIEGIAKTSALLMSANTYIELGWNYTATWGIEEGQAYPYLLWEIDIIPVSEITLDNTSLTIAQGKKATITAKVLPLGATNNRLEWKTSKKAVATVKDGVVTAVGIGTATITATATDGSNINATCKVTVVANKDAAIKELQDLVDDAQKLYDNSTEGENIGEYQSGARVALLAVIRNVKSRISSTMSDDEITSCTNDINDAVAIFKEKQVKAGEDTDITTFANVVFFENSEANTGQQVTLSLKMNNEIAPTGFQCDVYLPEGVTVAKDADNFNLISLSTKRTTAQKTNYFDSAEQPDGAIRIMCSSTKNYTFSGNDGEVATITLNVSDEIEEGEYPLILKNIVISDANSKSYTVDYVKSTLTISSYTLGDANNDGSVNVSDFTAIASYIMGTPPATFVKKAADVNADTEINVADLTGVATIILYGSFNPTSNAKSFAAVEPSVLSVRNQTVKAGAEFTIDVNINGKYAFSGYQFDMNLPEGISVKTIDNRNTDFFASGMTGENTMRVLSASTKGECFEGTESCVARITLIADENIETGDYAIDMNNIIISSNGNSQTLNDTKFVVHVGETTGITNINAEGEFAIYDMTGKMVKKATSLDGLKKGVYVVNGHKVIK